MALSNLQKGQVHLCEFVVFTQPPEHRTDPGVDVSLDGGPSTKNHYEVGGHILEKYNSIDWCNFCRELCVVYIAEHSQKIGGPGTVVEVDEA